jgi:hypothetical protein
MKTKLLLLILSLFLAPTAGRAQLLTTVIKQEAEKSAAALAAGDYAGVLAYTHPRVVELMGGKDAALVALRRSTEEMKSRGIAVQSAKLEPPQAPLKVGSWFTSIIPLTLTMRVPDGRVVQASHLLGISEDEGKTWRFLDLGPISDEKLFSLFPELRGKVSMPPKIAPVHEKRG